VWAHRGPYQCTQRRPNRCSVEGSDIAYERSSGNSNTRAFGSSDNSTDKQSDGNAITLTYDTSPILYY